MIKKKLEQSKILFGGINSVVFLIFLWMNFNTPLSGDDLIYQKIYGTETRISSLGDIIQSQVNHYQMWGGRSVVHFIDQIFLLFHKSWFNFANTIVFSIFVLLIYHYALHKKVSNSFLVLEYLLLWCTIPDPVDTIVWQTSSVNYLWGSMFILLYFFPYYTACHETDLKSSKNYFRFFASVLMFLGGILCGWTIEAGGAMLLVSIVFAIGYQIYKKRRIYVWEISGFLGALVGFAILILAPGNFNRADVVMKMTAQRSLFGELLFRVARETYYMLIHMWPLFAVMFLLFLMAKKKAKGKNIIFQWKEAIMFFAVALVGVYVMTASPAYAERVLVTPIAFAMIALGIMYNDVMTKVEGEK